MQLYRHVVNGARSVLEGSSYDYKEMIPNLIEDESLYNKSLGVTSDIVLKEMYSVSAAGSN